MQKVILYIQPQLRTTTTAQDYVRVDLMEEDLITLTQIIQDVKNIEKVFTDYSRTFNLPASKTNNKIFKYWYNPDVEGFDNQIMSNARIELNHFAFKEGKIRLESVTMKHGEPSLYKVTFFGNTTTVNDLIGEDSLTTLDWLNNFNHIANDTNVKNGLENGINFTVSSVSYPDAIIYPLIAHSQQYIYDATGNTTNGLNISTHTSHHLQRGVITEDLKPAILIKHIIKAIGEKYGFTFKSGEFFDSANVSNLYMWLHRVKGKMIAPNFKLVNDATFTCNSSATVCNHFSSSSPPIGPASLSGSYTFSDNNTGGEPEGFSYTTQVTPTVGTTIYTLEIINEVTGEVLATKEDVTGTQSVGISLGFSTPNPITQSDAFTLTTRVKSNSTIQFGVEIDCEHFVFNSSTQTYDTYAGNFTSNSSNISTSADINITDQIPDIKILDFLTGVFKMFNLTAYIDFNGEVVVKRLDDYFSGGETHNITEYIKTDTHSIGKTIPYSEIDLEYVEAKSILAQRFFNTNNRKYGEIEYKTDATDNKIYKVTVPFEHMLFSRLSDLTTNIFTDVQTGCFLDEELNPSIGQPLLFYGVQRTGITTGINYVFGTSRPDTYAALCPTGSSNSTLTSYYMPHHANELGSVSTAPTYNLNFGSEIDTYNLTDYAGQNNSLFLKNYQEYITRVYNKKTRLYRYSAILPLKVLLQLTLDDKVIVGTRIFTINTMTTKLQSGETEFELLNEAPE
tara:strand:- start:2940 stop:5141 length:2202 start_codon:yes stop_codon:yes gene_type:complete